MRLAGPGDITLLQEDELACVELRRFVRGAEITDAAFNPRAGSMH
jgi:hypothetical protein